MMIIMMTKMMMVKVKVKVVVAVVVMKCCDSSICLDVWMSVFFRR